MQSLQSWAGTVETGPKFAQGKRNCLLIPTVIFVLCSRCIELNCLSCLSWSHERMDHLQSDNSSPFLPLESQKEITSNLTMILGSPPEWPVLDWTIAYSKILTIEPNDLQTGGIRNTKGNRAPIYPFLDRNFSSQLLSVQTDITRQILGAKR